MSNRKPPQVIEITPTWFSIQINGACFWGWTSEQVVKKYWDYMGSCNCYSYKPNIRAVAAKICLLESQFRVSNQN
jgi:hypothetical protein